jgi:peroxiredoxin Q/BCP
MTALKVGVKAPDFSLYDQNAVIHQLSDFIGEWVVLYFYPKDDTPVCTKQACAFRDQFEDFKEEGAVVIGISSDDRISHNKFVEKHNLPFVLLSDEDGVVRKEYGAKSLFGLIPSRITYVINPKGTIEMVFNSLFGDEEHVNRSLALIRSSD